VALIIFRPGSSNPGMLNHNRSQYTVDEAVRRARDWQARLHKLGVPVVQLVVYGPEVPKKLTRVNDPEELRSYVRAEESGEWRAFPVLEKDRRRSASWTLRLTSG
jgi:hypothetical protein